MGIVLAAVLIITLVVTMAGTMIGNVQLLRTARDNWQQARRASTESLPAILGQTLGMFAVMGAWFGAVLAAPFGVRDTLTYLVVVPVLSLVFVGVLFVGIRGYRTTQHDRSQQRP